jgi:hypothetical protein
MLSRPFNVLVGSLGATAVACPLSCNGRGDCVSIGAMSLLGQDVLVPSLPGDGLGVTYTNWDVAASYGCNCYDGYTSGDCSVGAPGAHLLMSRRCPLFLGPIPAVD